MKTRNYLVFSLAALCLTFAYNEALACGCSKSCGKKQSKASCHKDSKDIVDVAVSAGQFETLVAAVKAAGLVDTLKGDGPFTVFAPTDEAFSRLPEGTVEDLLKPENRDRLQAVLTYHVVPGAVSSDEVSRLRRAKTVNGDKVKIKVKSGTVTVDDAKVVQADISAKNGVIHVIDTVLIPRS